MSDYFGDIRLGDTIDIKFTTRQISGAPFTLAGSPVISAYPSNSTTQLTAGITLSVDFDSVTGYNNVRVVATGGNGYLTATNYDLCITTGTVNSVSVVGESIGSFSIENRSALMPTTAALTLDVSATGEAGVDWANIGSKTSTVALTNTTVGTITTYTGNTVQTGDSYARLGAPAGASIAADLAEIEGETDGIAAISTATPLTAAQIATGVWQDATAGDFTTASSIGKSLYTSGVVPGGTNGLFIAGTNAATTITTGLTTHFIGTIDTLTTNSDKTGYALTAGERTSVADSLLDRDMSVGADNGAPTVRTVRQALRALRNKFSISGSTITYTKEDDATSSWTAVLTTDAAALPITGSDPAG